VTLFNALVLRNFYECYHKSYYCQKPDSLDYIFVAGNVPIESPCDFLLVINTTLHHISHCFQVIADYWSNYCIGVARGALGARAPPGRSKKIRPNLQRKVVNAPPAPGRECTLPRGRARVQFFEEIEEIWTVGEVFR